MIIRLLQRVHSPLSKAHVAAADAVAPQDCSMLCAPQVYGRYGLTVLRSACLTTR